MTGEKHRLLPPVQSSSAFRVLLFFRRRRLAKRDASRTASREVQSKHLAWSPDDKYVVGSYRDWDDVRLGVFNAATGALLDDVKIDSFSQTRVDFVGFTGDQCGDACQDLVASSFIRSSFSSTRNNLNFYDVLTLDADDARCQAPVPQSDGAKALAAGLAVPALAALAL